MQLVHHFLEESARRAPHKTAVVCGDQRMSFGEVDRAANRLANALTATGVTRGDRVATYLENSLEAVIAIFGILKAGAVVTTVNPSTRPEKLAYMLQDEAAAALVTANTARQREAVRQALRVVGLPTVIWVAGIPQHDRPAGTRYQAWDDLLDGASDEAPPPRTIDRDLASLIYTSGTTGTPKGVMSAHRDTAFAAASICEYLDNTANDIIFCSLSLAFTYGFYQLITATRVAATLVLERNFVFPHRGLEIMARERVTGFPGVPTMFALLFGLKSLDRYDLNSLRYVTNAAAPLPLHHVKAVRAAFPQAKFFSMYGQTECKRACYLPPEELDRRPDSVGIAIPGTEVYVADHDGHGVAPGTIGELVVRGSHLMRGYWGLPDETAKRLRPGPTPGERVMYTGDLFRTDDEGFLYFVSREDDIIKSRGEKVSPNEIERTLYGLDGVRDVAVVGVPDEILGEAIKVFVVPEDAAELTEGDVRSFCARRLEDFMMPKYVEFRTSLPKSDNGKTVRKSLKACVA
ncbi:MAG TPA: AMP-binding protein [Acidimicrobiales bacterium]|nr:AMP-binding protein [Acidimicrobiales bacterium]